MRSSNFLALFASYVAAQSSVTLLQIQLFNMENDTLTQIGSDATATTYTKSCTSGGIPLTPSSLLSNSNGPSASITPAPTPQARLARQASASSSSNSDDDDESDIDFCEPYTIKQGSSSWQFYFKDPQPGVWEASLNCNWQGALTDADLTCTVSQSGEFYAGTEGGATSTVVKKDEIKSLDIIRPVAVVTASQTSSGSGSGSGLPAKKQSTGAAPYGAPAPTAMAFVGGAAGILAAALAL